MDEQPIQECEPVKKEPIKYDGAVRPNSRFLSLLELKNKDGEKVEHLAALGKLYRQAVNYLRDGILRNSDGQRIFGATRAADKIEDYVKAHLATELSSESIILMKREELVREALYGFLYREAVGKLRNGYFNDLINDTEIANAIEKHVNTRILEYIEGTGVKL